MSHPVSTAAQRRRAILLVLASAATFTLSAAAVKALDRQIPLAQIVLFRNVFSMPVLVLMAMRTGGLGMLAPRVGFRLHAERIFWGLGGMFSAFWGYMYLPLATATALGFTMPLFLTALSVLILRETVGWRRWSAVAVGFAGVLVMLRPASQTLPAAERDALIARMRAALVAAVPGVGFGFTQPIQMRMNELLSGVRADVAVKVYGEDLPTLARLGAEIARVLRTVRGATDLRADRVEGMPVLRATIDRHAAARLGADGHEALMMVEAIGGRTVGSVLEGRQRYPLRVRLPAGLRDDLDALRRLPVHIAGDATVPLCDVATLEVIDEPVVINRESLSRRLVVQTNVRGRDLGGFAAEAQRAVARSVRLPPGYRLEWGGQFENLERARLRLAVVVPVALALILALLFASLRSASAALLIFANVPFAATGGVLALWARGLPLSLSAAVGFIALFGVAVLNGLVLMTQVRQLRAEGRSPAEAAQEGALRRLRPVLTTALVASLGFVPMALTTGAGSEVQRPLATVVIGGLITSTLLTLLVLPTLYAWLGRRDAP